MEKLENSYVVSEDIGLILEGNNIFGNYLQSKGIARPKNICIDQMRKRFKSSLDNVFDKVDIIPQSQMYFALNKLANNCSYPIVSLDRVYLNKNQNVIEFLDLTRLKQREGVSIVSRMNTSISYIQEISRLS